MAASATFRAFDRTTLLDSGPKNAPITALCATADGTRLYIGTGQGDVALYHLQPGSSPRRTSSSTIESMPKSPSVASVASAASSAKGDRCVLVSHTPGVAKRAIDDLALADNHDAMLLLSDSTPHIFRLSTLEPVHVLADAKAPMSFDVFSAPDTPTFLVALGYPKRVLLLEIDEQLAIVERKEYPLPINARSICFLTEEAQSLAIASSKEISILTLATAELVSVLVWSPTSFSLMLSSTPQTKVFARAHELVAFSNANVLRMDDTTGRVRMDWTSVLDDLVRCGPYLVGLVGQRSVQIKVGQKLVQSIDLAASVTSLVCVDRALFATNGTKLWQLDMVPIEALVDRLIADAQFESAIAIVEASDLAVEEKIAHVRSVQLAYAHRVFAKGKFEDAMAVFRDLCAPPDAVLQYFPFTLATASSSPPLPRRPGAAKTPAEIPEARRALARFLTERRSILNRLRAAAASGGATGGGAHSVLGGAAGGSLLGSVVGGRMPTAGPGSILASTSSLSSVARDYVARMSNELTPDEVDKQSVVVDTALLRLYLHDRSDSMLGSLLRVRNYCDVESTVAILTEYHKYSELIDFMFAKGLHERALDFLMQQASSATDAADRCGPLIAYLTKLEAQPDHHALIWRYLGWVFQADAALALDYVKQTRLDSGEIITFLTSLAPVHLIDYLEFMIVEQKHQAPYIHEQYIRNLVEMIEEARADHDEDTSELVPVRNGGTDQDVAAGTPVPASPSEESAALAGLHARLLRFLRESQAYGAATALAMLPTHGYYEEKLVLYERLGQYDRVLDLLVGTLRDVQRAQAVVERVNAFHDDLVQHCVAAGTTTTVVLAMLDKYLDHLDMAVILSAIPDSLPAAKVADLIARAAARLAAQAHSTAVVKDLARREHHLALVRVEAMRAGSVAVGERSLCPACGKKIGNSACSTWWNRPVVVHFGCRTNVPPPTPAPGGGGAVRALSR
ncbi:Vam6/Vps39-like protein [Allomyces javanicus]|nr:Vam6/Vps39-like protein [Allomyces javanicus]